MAARKKPAPNEPKDFGALAVPNGDGPVRIRFEDYTQMRRRAAGIEIVMGDDDMVFVIDPPDLWPDDVQRRATSDSEYVDLVMGTQAEEFKARGGTGRIINELLKQRAEMSVPESSASSES